ncbi:hypothetical protein ACFXAZ_09165 [Streptomyces sp. NPDC059477]|uniref:hypothetical protein n=1 Tax=Streptomyces sp. NPDC059477 TaxID=3346847 RepID=UPI003693E4CD
MSESSTAPEGQAEAAPDPAEAIRAEVSREYAAKLAQAELEAQAAKAGITLPEEFTSYLNLPRLIGEDGNPSAEAISRVLETFRPSMKLPPLAGAGHNRDGGPFKPHVSLDSRGRK